MSDPVIYVVTDGEFDGPVPGQHSMLSFASVAVTLDGKMHGEFEANLQRFSDERLLNHRPTRLFLEPLCLASIVLARCGKTPDELRPYPPAWLGDHEHTHRAIDDARGYAHLLVHLMNRLA